MSQYSVPKKVVFPVLGHEHDLIMSVEQFEGRIISGYEVEFLLILFPFQGLAQLPGLTQPVAQSCIP